MKVIDHLERAKEPLISFEIIPPLRGGSAADLLAVIDDLVKYRPPFIDITSHPALIVYEETATGYQRKVKRKRPGTLGICALIQNKYGIDAVPHVLCHGFTREETEDFLIELTYLGIDNVLAVRGDDSGYRKPLNHGRTANYYALDLVRQIAALNRGVYLEDELLDAEPLDFCVGVGGYPEKHFESPNLMTDLRYVKAKIEAGASYVVTQMFYDNAPFFRYTEEARAIGIDVPILPGLKILTTKRQVTSIPRNFHVDIPSELSDAVLAAKDEAEVVDIGVAWALRQTQQLLERGVPAVHFYIMQDSEPMNLLMKRLRR